LSYNKKIIDQQHQKTILPNGLTILSLAKADVASVAIEIWVKVGSRYESLDLNGIAHFIEHMNFKGTSRRSAKQIAEEFDAIGGYLNAYTSKEHTVYSAKVLTEFFPLAIDMLADIIFHSKYDEEDIEKEKNVVLQELAQAQDNPEEMVFEYFSEVAFANQAVGRTILGSKENILSFDRDKIIDFIHKHYVAPKIIISAAGNLTHEHLVELVKEKMKPFSGNEVVHPESSSYVGGHNFHLDNELSQLHLILGYKGVPVDSDDYYKVEMLASILGGSISSRLFQEIREKRGLVYSIGSFCQYNTDSGIFAIGLSASPEKASELFDLLAVEINKITHDISQDELDRCLAQVKSSLYMGRETVDSWVGALAGNYSCYGRYITREEIWSKYSEIQKEDLHDLAKKLFTANIPISVAALGDIQFVPEYLKLQKLLTYKE
jgi:predicted Zn-dependent peptidase